MKITFRLLAGLAVALAGCSSTPSTSTLEGTIKQASFPSAVTAIQVSDNNGNTTTVAVGKDGRFSVALAPGATYELALAGGDTSWPMALTDGRGRGLGAKVKVTSGGAKADLGVVRYWRGKGSRGVVPTLAPAAMTCSDAEENDNDDGEEGDHDDGDVEANDDGVDCVDGIDAQTQAPCDGGPEANDAYEDDDVDQAPMGVPRYGVPSVLGCGEEDDDDDDDGEEQDD